MHHAHLEATPALPENPVGTPYTPHRSPNSEVYQPDNIAADPCRALPTPVASPRPKPDQRARLAPSLTLPKPRCSTGVKLSCAPVHRC